MAAKLRFRDRTYDLPAYDTFTYREHGVVRDVAGIAAGETEQALKRGDVMIFVALLAVAKRRAGEKVDVDALLDSEFLDIEVIADAEAPEVVDPDGPPLEAVVDTA